ncbi:MAG: RagB/SusD family nutrient uptake outer membrane protein [Chitinophagaceae bacterium]|nr:RagB/SusD family nutrient uptake outer membrane protein [Chitinophagaceae bacterium]
MKKYRIKISVIFITIIFIKCSSFLDIKPQGELTQASFPKSSSDALLAVNATYSTLRNWFYHSGGYPILDIMSDDAYKGSNPGDQFATVGPYNTFNITTTQDGLDRWWTTLFLGIKQANVVIENIPNISMDEKIKNTYIAEAKFLRALYYFDMVRAWGDVPLVTTTAAPLQLPRTPKKQIYEQIIQDFQQSLEALPEKSAISPDQMGRATKGAAKSFLAKVYLFQNDFVNAEKYATEVILSGQYSLEENFSDANSEKGEYGVESIFEIGARRNEGFENGGDQYSNNQGVRGTPNRGWGFNRPSLELKDSFEPNDPRMDATIIFLHEILDGIEILGDGTTPDIVYDTNGKLIEIECYNQKVWTLGNNTITAWAYNRRLLRYADILLIAAEASNENGKTAEALKYLNTIRKRARGNKPNILPDITETNKTKLRDIILDERRHELALEGHRFWDLIRTGKAEQILSPLGFVKEKNEVLPIPQTEIDLSQGTLKQNDGY